MSKETPTPGPWKIGRQNRHDAWIHNEAGETVAYVHNATGYQPDCSDDPNARLIAAAPELDGVAEALLLFHSADWSEEKRTRWTELTGSVEATTKILCDFARRVRAKAGVQP